MNKPASIADALVTALNAQAFALSLGAVRMYAPVFQLEQLKELKVCVCPRTRDINKASRCEDHDDIEIDIWFLKQVRGKVPNSEIDPLADLVEAVTLFCRRLPVSGVGSVSWISTKQLYVIPDYIQTKNVFGSVITQTYRSVVDT